MNKGEIRVMIGSTQKCGAGMNAQERMIALHDLDAPMRPSDMEQRHGRIIRQGNTNTKVDIYRYTTDKTFDAYLYQMLENKQKFISQIMTDKSPVRSCEDVDEIALDYAEVKALCAGNPLIKEKIDLETEITKLNVLKSSFLSRKYAVQDKAYTILPREKSVKETYIDKLKKMWSLLKKNSLYRMRTVRTIIPSLWEIRSIPKKMQQEKLYVRLFLIIRIYCRVKKYISVLTVASK